MKSLTLTAYSQLEVVDATRPVPHENELLLRVAACGICGSDVHGYDGSSGRRIPPIVMGHEAAGVVEAVGSSVTRFRPGDRITFDSTVYCGACEFCLRGEVNLCDHREVVGVSCGDYRRAGAFAEYVVVPEHIVYRLPDGLSFPEAAMLEAVAVALHAVHLSEPADCRTALVIGAGMIGLLTAQAARALGIPRVMIADVDASRLDMARSLGLTETLHLSGEALVAAALDATGGMGVDLALEAVGREETVRAAIDAVRKGGRVTLIGNIQPTISLPLQKVVTRQIRLQGSAASAGEYPEAMELIAAGKIQVKPLISAVAPLEEGASWFSRLHAREAGLIKVILSPDVNEAQA
ncbi:L-iditol 2-dehydrogenase [Bryocella elongata]|uniref:L-iditol 2-dehydrogenase n=1 Tax=Bryocella elongata TaxID=863522 RepID=A0A1H5Z2V7_9BACT|nr:galactitol-1-phosphate 5-dehydrogenase [Bryocella elongata]SEG30651.1 L-iditol 2-dehydrogenase [Bryocella elongata]